MNPPSPTSASVTRRSFFQAALAGAVTTRALAADAVRDPGTFNEPARDIPIVDDSDVIVCGGGPAGVAAAITAARAGARTRLFEWRGCLGGVWTAGLLGYLLDFNKPGFAAELARKLEERGMRRGQAKGSICYEPEGMKWLLEDLCTEAGVKFQLHTRVASAYRDGRRLQTIVTDSKGGRQAWRAPVYIDTTGDGDLGALAGCEWEIGQGENCPCQPMSLNALLVVKDAAALTEFIHASDPGPTVGQAKKNFRKETDRIGFSTSYNSPTLWQVRDNLLLAMMNHEFGVKPFDPAEVTAATVRARAEMNRIVNGLRGLGGPWEGIQIAATAEQIGVRDGRRLRGRYVVSKDDVVNGARHDDAVARATFSIDVHQMAGGTNPFAPGEQPKVKPYDIPLRALLARDVDGLLMAGRCISGDFIAHSSYRVTGNAVAMGEAAGVTAALAAATKRLPHEVAWPECVEKLEAIAKKASA